MQRNAHGGVFHTCTACRWDAGGVLQQSIQQRDIMDYKERACVRFVARAFDRNPFFGLYNLTEDSDDE